MDMCSDNRFTIIGKAKKHLLESTNIECREDEMKVIDNILFRCWQMGWLDRYDDSKKSIDEEELEKLATSERHILNKKLYEETPENEFAPFYDVDWEDGFKAGYRKAKEE